MQYSLIARWGLGLLGGTITVAGAALVVLGLMEGWSGAGAVIVGPLVAWVGGTGLSFAWRGGPSARTLRRRARSIPIRPQDAYYEPPPPTLEMAVTKAFREAAAARARSTGGEPRVQLASVWVSTSPPPNAWLRLDTSDERSWYFEWSGAGDAATAFAAAVAEETVDEAR